LGGEISEKLFDPECERSPLPLPLPFGEREGVSGSFKIGILKLFVI